MCSVYVCACVRACPCVTHASTRLLRVEKDMHISAYFRLHIYILYTWTVLTFLSIDRHDQFLLNSKPCFSSVPVSLGHSSSGTFTSSKTADPQPQRQQLECVACSDLAAVAVAV